MERHIKEASEIIAASRSTLALTGAGISVESGIPDFRSESGLWAKYDPAEYATITAFHERPEKVWEMFESMDKMVEKAKPNSAHTGMAELERIGCLHYIITQNVDNLHQSAGSANVIEYHGNCRSFTCPGCQKKYRREEIMDTFPPKCRCGLILKPDIVFFGEAIPEDALIKSFHLASNADVLLVVGTSAVVSPANTIPSMCKQNGAKVIEINLEKTHLTNSIADMSLQGSAGIIIPALVMEIKKIKGH